MPLPRDRDRRPTDRALDSIRGVLAITEASVSNAHATAARPRTHLPRDRDGQPTDTMSLEPRDRVLERSFFRTLICPLLGPRSVHACGLVRRSWSALFRDRDV